jgi:DNA-binding HxlR family transcriptional regulator
MLMSELILSLKKQKISLGEPWKLPKASGFLIPLLKHPPNSTRNYVLLQEVENQVDFRDSGGISGVDALNKSGKNVYIRKGTMLKGGGTQSRAPTSSFVLPPDMNYKRIPVNCIHQSHGISRGSKFKAVGVTPMEVYSSLGEQSSTWASISRYTSKVQSRMSNQRPTIRPDNLVGVESKEYAVEDVVVDALKNIPGDHVYQVGVAVFNIKGIVAVELFNHPDSWKAFSQSIIRSYRHILLEEAGDLIEIRTDKAKEVFARYLEKLDALKRTLVTENKVSKVWALRDTGIEGELTVIDGEEIHLLLNRIKDKPRAVPIRGRQMRFINIEEPIPPSRPQIQPIKEDASVQFIQKRGGYNILSELSQAPKRFKDLLDKVNVSRGTLASRIREAEEIGLIEKGIRKSNGSPAYTLTEVGEKTKKQGDKKAR